MADRELFSLLDKAYRKDPDAVNELINRYYPQMYETAFTVTGNDSDAEKAVENTCTRMINGLASLDDANQFEQWLNTITREESLKLTGFSHHVSDLSYNAEDEHGTNAGEVKGGSKNKQKIIQRVFGELTPEERIIFSMHFKDGRTVNEISDELNISYQEVGSILQSSKNKVNAEVNKLEETENLKIGTFSPLGFFAALLRGWKPEIKPSAAAGITSAVTGEGYDPAKYSFREKTRTDIEDIPAQKSAAGEKAAVNAKAVSNAAAHKAASTGFFASTAGKAVIAAAVSAAVAVTGTVVYVNVTGSRKPAGSTASASDHAATPLAGITEAARPTLLSADSLEIDMEVSPSVAPVQVSSDFGNTLNPEAAADLDEAARAKLLENQFVVSGDAGYEFFDIYEDNVYNFIPSFVTTDSILHTFHLYYVYMQKQVERDYLKDELTAFSNNMLAASQGQLSALTGTEWETAAQRNVDFYSIALSLLGENASLSQNAQDELSLINAAQGLDTSHLFSTEEYEQQMDYSQFKPRSYYTESPELEEYFKAMMWYGQCNFTARDEDLSRSALLNTLAIRDSAEEEWNTIYEVTAFFAGESDDHCYTEYLPVIVAVYGNNVSAEDLAGKDSEFQTYQETVKKLSPPKINSMVVYSQDDRDEATNGFRVLGSRFTIDGLILQKLTYRDVEENENKEQRLLPDALDVPAALGSDEALNILNTTTDVGKWPDYAANMESLRNDIAAAGEAPWPASISSAWLGSLRPLLKVHGEGWPTFMQSTAWTDKNLNTFLGNYTELKHDTVLYAKQTMAELGADTIFFPDDRGYVEPEPQIYQGISKLCESLENGLKSKNLISDDDCSSLENFKSIADELYGISVKELNDEILTEDEYDFIRSYGGNLEHLWLTAKEISESYASETYDHPAALVTDIATDSVNSKCLELAEGNAAKIYVIVPVAGILRIARGSVYSFYQFEQPLSDRLTDEEWQQMVYDNNLPSEPVWVSSFKTQAPEGYYHDSDFANKLPESIASLHADTNTAYTYSTPDLNSEKTGLLEEGRDYYVYEIQEDSGTIWYRIAEDVWVPDQNDGSVTRRTDNW